MAVNCAAVEAAGAVEDLDDVALQEVFAVNTLGPVRVARALMPTMRSRGGGAIVSVSSLAARFAPPLYGAYSASKAALDVMSSTLRYELQPAGVRVTTVVLGDVDHDMSDVHGAPASAHYTDLVAQHRARLRRHQDQARPRLSDIARQLVELVDRAKYPERVVLGGRGTRLAARMPQPLRHQLARSGPDWTSDRRDG